MAWLPRDENNIDYCSINDDISNYILQPKNTIQNVRPYQNQSNVISNLQQ